VNNNKRGTTFATGLVLGFIAGLLLVLAFVAAYFFKGSQNQQTIAAEQPISVSIEGGYCCGVSGGVTSPPTVTSVPSCKPESTPSIVPTFIYLPTPWTAIAPTATSSHPSATPTNTSKPTTTPWPTYTPYPTPDNTDSPDPTNTIEPTETPENDDDHNDDEHCDQGRGNGDDDCSPGNSDHNHESNDSQEGDRD